MLKKETSVEPDLCSILILFYHAGIISTDKPYLAVHQGLKRTAFAMGYILIWAPTQLTSILQFPFEHSL